MIPFGIISDTHHHNWSSFATTNAEGINSRLQMILDETERCAAEIKAVGGTIMFHGGDLFHVRGSIAPSVLNPTIDCYKRIVASGVIPVIDAGNHDLEGKEATRVSSAITALEGIGCIVINKPTVHYCGVGSGMAIVPWTPNVAELKQAIEDLVPVADRADTDLLLHAPIDGVIPGLPDHGITDTYLAALGFRRVFAGHYHHHKDFGNGVYSIGALTAQTWSDVGAKAGFLICDDKVTWRASRAPSFVEIDGSVDPHDVPLLVDGNYAKVTINSSKASDVENMRDFLLTNGAKGVIVLSDTKSMTPTARAGGASLKAGETLESSIGHFITAQGYKRSPDLAKLCGDILTNVRSVA